MIFQNILLGASAGRAIMDDFNRSNAVITWPWTSLVGDWFVDSNQLVTTTDHERNPVVVQQAHSPDVDISLDVGSLDGIAFRVRDENNFWRLYAERLERNSPIKTTSYTWAQKYSVVYSGGAHDHTHEIVTTTYSAPTFSDPLHTHGSEPHTKIGTPYVVRTNDASSGTALVLGYTLVLEAVVNGLPTYGYSVDFGTTPIIEIRAKIQGSSLLEIYANGSGTPSYSVPAADLALYGRNFEGFTRHGVTRVGAEYRSYRGRVSSYFPSSYGYGGFASADDSDIDNFDLTVI